MALKRLRTMSLAYLIVLLNITFFCNRVTALASTDTITWGGDISRSGYQNNHNMDPAVVGSSQFGLLFKTLLPGNYGNVPEQIFSQPLVYTSSDGIQYLFIATTQNNVYKLNAKTGAILAKRNLHIPFLTADLDGCVDINPQIGITATGVIDPATDTWYLTSKTYIDQKQPNVAQGRPAGRYYVHAIDTNTLQERPNFPINLEGMVARNNPVRSFSGGIHHQRPALLHHGQYIYMGFASHCVQYNFTGWIVGFDKTQGTLVERFATEGAGVANTIPGAGVWMSGGGIASDGKGSLWFASGNGYASQLDGVPVSGRSPPTALEEAAVHMTIGDDGSLTVVDFFMPWEKKQLDGADKDLGTTPLEILPSQFACGSSQRIGVVTGKSGKTYWLNLDDLGGYQNGPNKLDAAIQVYQNENSVYAGAGVYPLEGGYVYINVIQYKTHVFKFSCSNGVPSFTKVADSPESNAYILGTGHGTVTSLNDQAGTGLLWVSDVEGYNLRIYNAVPVNGALTLLNAFNTPSVTKFTRPVFGDGIAYQGTTQGYIYAYGSPVNLPMNCSSPYDFGTADINSTAATRTIQCKVFTTLQITSIALSGNPNFVISGIPTLPLTVNANTNFSFQAAFAPKQVGPLSSDIIVNTTQAIAGYSINTPIRLKGNAQSLSPLLSISPNVISFEGVITGQQAGGVNQSVLFANLGNGNMTISNIKFSVTSETGSWISPNSSTASSTTLGPYTFYNLPSSIAPNTVNTVIINFNPSTSGNYPVYVQVNSNGGTKVFDIVGTGADYPHAVLEFQTPDGSGWVKYDNTTAFTFGNVTENTTRNLKMRLTNNGTSNSARLSVTVSKPPFGVTGIINAVNNVDLAEGVTLGPGESATATLYCAVPKSQINLDSYNGTTQWTMNLGDPNFGKQYIKFFCNAVSEQYPPLRNDSTGLYRYTGCFKENNPGRQLQTMLYSSSSNTNEMCLAACAVDGYIFSGTQYNSECWCGMLRPKEVGNEANCDYSCSGNVNEVCGGDGINNDHAYLSLFADSSRFSGNLSEPVGPFVNPGVNGYTSLGCYSEGTTGRALTIPMTVVNNTVARCTSACAVGGYQYVGVEYGQECYCGNTLGAGSVPAASTDCSMTCTGNYTEFCGSGGRLNLYLYGNGSAPTSTTTSMASSTASPTSSVPVIIPQAYNYSYVDCHTEATAGRALSLKTVANDTITVEVCAAFCQNTLFMAVEYTRECYCGDSINAGSVTATDGRCNMLCAGNTLEYCGGPNGLQLYKFNPPNATTITMSNRVSSNSSASNYTATSLTSTSSRTSTMSNSTTTTSASALSATSNIGNPMTGSSTSMSIAANNSTTVLSTSTSSVMSSSRNSTTLAPTASSSSSAVGNSTTPLTATSKISSTSVTSNSTTVSSTSLASSTSTSSSLSTTSSSQPQSSSSFSSFTSSSSSTSFASSTMTTSTISSSSSSTPPSPSPWISLGCVNETTPRALSGASTTSSNMSIETCQTFCSAKNFPLAGLEYAKECYCGSSLGSYSTTGFTGCTMRCAGDNNQLCGGSSRLSVYNNTAYLGPVNAPTILLANSNSNSSGTYKYLGCWSEAVSGRTLGAYSFTSASMTVELCAATCASKGYSISGNEYGRECWCGNGLAGTSTLRAESECSMVCPGKAREYCGGGSRLTVYKAG